MSLIPLKTPISLKRCIFKLLWLPCWWYSKLVPYFFRENKLCFGYPEIIGDQMRYLRNKYETKVGEWDTLMTSYILDFYVLKYIHSTTPRKSRTALSWRSSRDSRPTQKSSGDLLPVDLNCVTDFQNPESKCWKQPWNISSVWGPELLWVSDSPILCSQYYLWPPSGYSPS